MPSSRHIFAVAPGEVARAAAAAVVALAVVACAVPSPARADGDPASDVLVSQRAFVAADAGASTSAQVQLERVLAAAATHGYPVRVALIGSATDLGSVTALWRRPQSYAHFLGLELSFAVHGPVLVVMPNGVGLFTGRSLTAAEQSALAAAGRPSAAADLASRAVQTVARLARAAGHPLPPAVLTPAAAVTARPGSGTVPWIVFAAGAVLIALAWTLSLRARPVGRHQDAGPA